MRDQAEVARRLESVVGDTLVDYFTVYLPVQLLVVDIIGLERRTLPAPTEFCLRAIDAGLRRDVDICGLLGLEVEYGGRLLKDLCESEYISIDAFGEFQLLRRGRELLRQEGEASPSDRRMQVLWDPVQSTILDRTLVYTKNRTDHGGILAPIPYAFAPPVASSLEISQLNKLRNQNSTGVESGGNRFEILRVTEIQKSFGRYRDCLAMVFKSSDGDIALRLAVNGSIDEELTAACVRLGLPKIVGVDRRINLRSGVQAVQKRHRELVCAGVGNKNVQQLVSRRSLLRLKMDGFRRRLAEDYLASVDVKLQDAKQECDDVDAQLARLPVVPVRCYEVDQYLIEGLINAKSRLTITSTIPSGMKIDGVILGHIRSCIARKVHISLYISDRIGENDSTLAIFEKLSHSGFLSVHFLQNDQRSVFEIEWDGEYLLFGNEPPFGNRRSPILPREFAGYFVSDKKAISSYRAEFLTFNAEDLLVRLRAATSATLRAAPRQRSRGRENVLKGRGAAT